MTQPLSIPINLENTGQVFACCGLIEIAHNRHRDVEAWFGPSVCYIRAAEGETVEPVSNVLRLLREADWTQDDRRGDQYTRPQECPSIGLALDWWLSDVNDGVTPKTWSGVQNVTQMIASCRSGLPLIRDTTASPFDDAAVLKQQPFYFDVRRSGDARDIGYSPDKSGVTLASFPAVELLALIGLQRFRPVPSEDGRMFGYSLWGEPLPVSIAAGVLAGRLPILESCRYQFEFLARDTERKRKSFGKSQLVRSSDVRVPAKG